MRCSSRCLIAAGAMCLSVFRAGAADLPRDAAECKAFFDPVFEREMARGNIPGAVLAFVTADGFVFLAGYGVADVETGAPMDPETTLVRAASISKLFTASAVLQLAEQGRLGLAEDVNAYLRGFQLPGDGGPPVTLTHLLTHTAGFDDRFLGMGAETRATLGPLGDYLARRLPPRVFRAGEVMSYSNHGVALAGHVVEAVSGVRFEDYAARHIFAPLAMHDSTFDLPDAPPPTLATGYVDLRGAREPAVYDFPQTVPASSLVTTAADMAQFMRSQLGAEGSSGTELMAPATLARMHALHFTHHPGLPGRALGWQEYPIHGLRVLEHGGLIWGFSSLVQIVPEQGVGLFVCNNTQSGGLGRAVTGAFYGHFFPRTPEPRPAAPPEALTPPADSLRGAYRHVRHTQTTVEKLATIAAEFIREVHVLPGAREGELRLQWVDTLGGPRHGWRAVAVGDGLYRRPADDGHLADRGRVAFRVPEPGAHAQYLFIEDDAYMRLAWYEQRRLLLGAVAFSLGVAATVVLLWPVAAIVRRWRGKIRRPRAGRIALGATWTACLLELAFAAGLGLFLWTASPYAIGYGPPPALVAVLCLPLAAAACWLVAVAAWASGPARHGWGLVLHAHWLLAAGAAPVYFALLHYWNLLGFRFG